MTDRASTAASPTGAPPRNLVPWWRSIRLRIAVLTAVVSAVCLGGGFVVVDHRASIDARERLRDRALTQLSAVQTIYEATGKVRLDASVDPKAGPRVLQAADLSVPTTYFDGQSMWAAHRIAADKLTLTVQLSGSSVVAERNSLRSAFIAAGLAGLALTAALSALVAQSLARRLRRAATEAAHIANGDPTRIEDRGSDEIAVLVQAVNRMADNLTRRLEVEKAFTADVSHELRTPMTALVSSVELLPDGEVPDLVRSQVDRLRRLVEDLLEISRLESDGEPVVLTPVAIDTLVTDSGVEVSGDSTAVVLAEPRRVQRVLTNLVDNARKHGRSEPLIALEGCTITVSDDGPGFPESVLTHGPQRFHRMSDAPGSGLGLTIALRQAEAMGAQLTLSNAPHGGAQATLTLQPHT